MDAEFSALSQATREATWFRALLDEIGYKQYAPTPVHCDNRAAIELSKDNKFHNCAKHIDIRHHHIRDMVRAGATIVPYVRSGENVADQFTKALPRDQHAALIRIYGLST
jgi:ATP sulfurylase